MTISEFIPTNDFAFDIQETGPTNCTINFANVETNADILITISITNLIQIRDEISKFLRSGKE